MSGSRAALPKIWLFLFSLLLTLMVLEVGFRVGDVRGFHEDRTREWMDARVSDEERIPGVHLQLKPHETFRMAYDSNPRGYFDEANGITYHTNNHGHRGPDFSAEKSKGTFRIIVLGDSFTLGEGVLVDEIFTARMQEMLREEVAENIEVINLGMSAYSTSEEIIYLRHVGIEFDPDLVLMVFVPNDAEYAGGLDLFEKFRNVYEAPAFIRSSYLASFAYARIAREIVGRRYVEALEDAALNAKPEWERVRRLLREGKRLARSVGARYAMVLFPFMFQLDEDYPLHGLHGLVKGIANKADIPYLDLFDSFEGRPYADLWVHPSDQHPNEIAHGIAARAMTDFLVRQELAPSASRD